MQPPENRRYSLRLRERVAWYDTIKSNMWHDFPAGSVISDPAVIELLEARGAPSERIYEGDFLR
jgi:hypothetical protein